MINLEKYGILGLYAEKPPINTNASISEAATIADYYNTAAYLDKTFFQDNSTILNMHNLGSGGKVTLMRPSGPYSEEAVMVIAKGPLSFDQENVKTETIYDYPFDVQTVYWTKIIAGMRGFEQLTQGRPDAEHFHIFATENCIAERTSSSVRTSRSIALPHAQIIRLDDRHIEPADFERKDDPEAEEARIKPIEQTNPNLRLEQRILSSPRFIGDAAEEVQVAVINDMHTPLSDMEIRDDKPYGYSFTPSPTGDIKEITRMMQAHHRAYTHVAQRLLAESNLKPEHREKIIPQPSYRLIMTLEDGIFRPTITPEFVSHSGVLEAGGLELKRGSNYPRRIMEQERAEIQDNLTAIIRDELYSNFADSEMAAD